ncbi:MULTISPECIES: Uma2 family endonuclease [unclassified Anabaena]|uniref:Uma2 family endonuclease n=1 Tax=unclassified Anabaena TaxID=2619674 RepID=UPI000835290F|nr:MULTISPECIES: Uma2 family endonuclease [unclassified Anabaena]
MRSPINLFTVDEYLELEKSSELRHEYLGGQIFAMSGGSKEHNLIAGNIYSRLRSHLRGSSCSVFMADMKIKINLASEGKNLFYYPDVTVTCDREDKDRFYLNYPCLIIEVLSPSTETIDRREKLVNYRNLESLQEYVLVSQDELKIEVYRRDSRGNWLLETLGQTDDLNLNSVGLTLTMAEIYEDVINI